METKTKLLKGMDRYVREHVYDECMLERWLMAGVPDCATENDFLYIAEDEDEFSEVINLFVDIYNEYWKD